MMRVLTVVALTIAAPCGSAQAAVDPRGFDPREIRAAERAIITALESPDPTAWVYMYTEDAVFLEAGAPPIVGRQALLDMARAAYPGCPSAEAETIAGHACLKYSGRVGRSAAARNFEPEAITLAVTADVRHRHSQYDKLLAQGWDRGDARHAVADVVNAVVQRWSAR